MSKMNTQQVRKLDPLAPPRKTETRKEMCVNFRKQAKAKREQQKLRMPPKVTVTVDTSKAKSNIEVVRMCIKELGWREYAFGRKEVGCDIHWHGVNFYENPDVLLGNAKVNKFPGMNELTRKINLSRCLGTMQKLFPEEYNFYPKTWSLPAQFHEFAAEVSLEKKHNKGKPKQTYIVKPDDGSQGDGIYLLRDPNDYIMNHRSHVVQEYLGNPFLIDNLKFDLRLYVVVTSIDPLKVHISKEGMARFCTVPYQEPKNKNLREAYMHLTNYSLNKHSETFVHTENDHDGSKRTLTSVFQKMEKMGYDMETVWCHIEKVVVKTMLALVPELKVELQAEIPDKKFGPSCFHILGFDILLLNDLKAMLLEVNSSPSLRLDYEHEKAPGIVEYLPSPVDIEIKKPVIKETLMMIAPKKKLNLKSARSKSSMSRKTSSPANSEIIETDQNANELPVPNPPSTQTTPRHSTTEKEEEEKYLYELFPEKYGSVFEDLRVLERLSAIFIQCLGVRGSMRMGATGFRTFTRKCRLNTNGLSNAAIDIMFIELHRKWEFLNPDRTTGLGFQGFSEAFMILAKKKFYNPNKAQMVENLLDFCEANLHFGKYAKCTYLPKVMMTQAENRLQQMKSIYETSKPQRPKPEYYFTNRLNRPFRGTNDN